MHAWSLLHAAICSRLGFADGRSSPVAGRCRGAGGRVAGATRARGARRASPWSWWRHRASKLPDDVGALTVETESGASPNGGEVHGHRQDSDARGDDSGDPPRGDRGRHGLERVRRREDVGRAEGLDRRGSPLARAVDLPDGHVVAAVVADGSARLAAADLVDGRHADCSGDAR